MKNFLSLIAIALTLFACQKNKDTDLNTSSSVYYYDAASGECKNSLGQNGYNEFNLANIVKTKSAECVMFPRMHLVYVLDTAAMADFHEFGNNSITGYNFKGANLDSASIFFNNISACNFEGVKMLGLEGGYANISVKIDQFTQIQPGACTTSNDSLFCMW